jgi:hypothetical protein
MAGRWKDQNEGLSVWTLVREVCHSCHKVWNFASKFGFGGSEKAFRNDVPGSFHLPANTNVQCGVSMCVCPVSRLLICELHPCVMHCIACPRIVA